MWYETRPAIADFKMDGSHAPRNVGSLWKLEKATKTDCLSRASKNEHSPANVSPVRPMLDF